MSDGIWMQMITGLYLACNGTRLLAYLPQIRALLHDDRADGASFASWVVFPIANASTFGYSLAIGSAPLMVAYAAANLCASVLVVALAWKAHRRLRDDRRSMHRSSSDGVGGATTGLFYAAGHAEHAAVQAATPPVTSAGSMRPSSMPWQATSAAPCRVSSGRSTRQRSLA